MTTTTEFITALFCQVDDHLAGLPKHPEAHLWPSEVVTLGLLHALKGVGNRPFYRWLTRDYRPLFPRLPERTRLFRLLKTHQDWTQAFLAAPTVLGVIDTYGIELIHPMREGRSPQQIGRKGLSNHRWIVGGKLCLLLNQWGLIVGWACGTANTADNTFHWLIQQVDGWMIVLSDTGFHAAAGDPSNLKLCQRGEWEDRMLVETVDFILVRVEGRLFTVYHRKIRPELLAAVATAIPDMKRNDLAGDRIHSDPDPLFVRFLLEIRSRSRCSTLVRRSSVMRRSSAVALNWRSHALH